MPAPAPDIGPTTAARLSAIGVAIRHRRKALGVSATTTAESAGISRVTLHRIERGNRSVTIGAYLEVIAALGLEMQIVDTDARSDLPERIRLSDYPQLKLLAWQRRPDAELTPEEALALYERNWRHVDVDAMGDDERAFVRALGGGRLLVRP